MDKCAYCAFNPQLARIQTDSIADKLKDLYPDIQLEIGEAAPWNGLLVGMFFSEWASGQIHWNFNSSLMSVDSKQVNQLLYQQLTYNRLTLNTRIYHYCSRKTLFYN